jgi:hypothetical protein
MSDEQPGYERYELAEAAYHEGRKEALKEAAQLCFEYAAKCGDSAEEYAARRLGDAIRALGAT